MKKFESIEHPSGFHIKEPTRQEIEEKLKLHGREGYYCIDFMGEIIHQWADIDPRVAAVDGNPEYEREKLNPALAARRLSYGNYFEYFAQVAAVDRARRAGLALMEDRAAGHIRESVRRRGMEIVSQENAERAKMSA